MQLSTFIYGWITQFCARLKEWVMCFLITTFSNAPSPAPLYFFDLSLRMLVYSLTDLSNPMPFPTFNHKTRFISTPPGWDTRERSVLLRKMTQWPWLGPFSSPERTIFLARNRDRELCPDPIFWVCAEFSFRILSQSDLPGLTWSLWIADFRCWTRPELSIPAAGQKDHGLWGREWVRAWTQTIWLDSSALYH